MTYGLIDDHAKSGTQIPGSWVFTDPLDRYPHLKGKRAILQYTVFTDVVMAKFEGSEMSPEWMPLHPNYFEQIPPSIVDPAVHNLFRTTDFRTSLGDISLQLWPEGLVLWVGGEIQWKSWEKPSFAPPPPESDQSKLKVDEDIAALRELLKQAAKDLAEAANELSSMYAGLEDHEHRATLRSSCWSSNAKIHAFLARQS